ncbi:thioredoxin family protein [Flavobacterium circumlabens]|uniref:thioredoxin family protein n=1 Tax=Flavobacterium circumlabens TaxID=2133765 RepID=UPI001EE95779|nr:thioredoxin fold domain-containing protein [Flavobacterium circumlabens]
MLVLLSGSILLPDESHAQLKKYQFEQLDSLQNIQKRKVIVFIHTDWCKYCQAMENTSLKNKDIIEELNSNFYYIDLNAEEKKIILYKKYSFSFKPTGNHTGINDLAKELATVDGQISYPTLCFLNDKGEIIFQQTNYMTSIKFIEILKNVH